MNLLCQFHTHPIQHLVKGFQGNALLLICRLLHPYAISKNRQAAISLLEVFSSALASSLQSSDTSPYHTCQSPNRPSVPLYSSPYHSSSTTTLYVQILPFSPTAPFITSERAKSSASCSSTAVTLTISFSPNSVLTFTL